MSSLPPHLSEVQVKASTGSFPPVPKVCVVTGGTGFVGQRVVEMLLSRGAERVVSFDIVPRPAGAWDHPNVEYTVGDIADPAAVSAACRGADCVWHIAAAVGPFHPKELYQRVNYQGTLNVIEACREHKVPKIVMASSPSTRFDGSDVNGLTEDEMPALPLDSYMQAYAETKAQGEIACREADCDELLTVAVAPHQVYGPRDNLFMPNILEAAGTGLLRVFDGPHHGRNRVCFTHVDNYAHALILAERALTRTSPARGKFYVVTDGNTHPAPEGYAHFWEVVDEAVKGMGFTSIWTKYKLPYWLMMPVAHVCDAIGWVTGRKLKINPFNVRVLTMHRWFNIAAAQSDLDYTPIVPFKEGWADTIGWFKSNWLPRFLENSGNLHGIASQTEAKINVQANTIS